MRKKIVRFSVLPLVAVSIFYSFSTKEGLGTEEFTGSAFLTSHLDDLDYTVSESADLAMLEPGAKVYPKLGKSYLAFKEAIGFKESGGDYEVVNDFGYLGKYQFGRGTLEVIGIRDTNKFLNDPTLQEAAFYANTARNKWILRRDIKRFAGKTINGVTITESGILAAAHLAGPGNVKKYLRSWGASDFSDGFGTSIKTYFKKFAGYDTSFIEAERLPQVKIPSAV
ncbi:peptidoglycan-binding protein LysM [Salinimicrobium sp. GXAS 041]|uniref:peptidoglycan-binding protein LysM n=1 Tax=Salinimicrobium sp. GXAS 041 TaxID=3400806 RepID=UPI003C70FB09